jgi:TolB-like protein
MSAVPPTGPARVFRALVAAGALGAIGLTTSPGMAATPGHPRTTASLDATAIRQTPTVAVLDFTSSALGRYATDYAPLGKGIPDQLIFELRGNPAVRLVDRDRIQEIIAEQDLSKSGRIDPESVVRIGKLLGVHHMLTGSYLIQENGDMTITVSSTDAETGEVEYADQVSGSADKVIKLIADLGKKLNTGLKLPPMPADAPKRESGSADPNQMKLLILMGRAQEFVDKKNVPEAIKVLKEALDLSPNYTPARTQLVALQMK